MSHSTRHTDTEAVEAVLFDLSGTTLDEGYLRHALASVAAEMRQHWQIDSSDDLIGYARPRGNTRASRARVEAHIKVRPGGPEGPPLQPARQKLQLGRRRLRVL